MESIASNTVLAKAASFKPNDVKYCVNSSTAIPPSAFVSIASKINGKVASIDALFDASLTNYIYIYYKINIYYY